LFITHSDVLDPRLLCGHSYLQKNTEDKLCKDDFKSTSVPDFWREVAFYIAAWLTSTTGMPTMPKMYLTPSVTEKETHF
jgi:hypothetical protein